jgi:hypothetical protein
MSKSLAEELAMMAHTVGTASSTPLVTSYVSAKNFGRAFLIARLGDMANETIDVAFYQGQGGSTNAKSLKAATQLAASASANDNGVVIIGVDLNDLDVTNGYTHIAGRIVTGNTTGGTCTIIVLGGDCRYAPASLVDGTVLGLTP